jgi:hypothetical protein
MELTMACHGMCGGTCRSCSPESYKKDEPKTHTGETFAVRGKLREVLIQIVDIRIKTSANSDLRAKVDVAQRAIEDAIDLARDNPS